MKRFGEDGVINSDDDPWFGEIINQAEQELIDLLQRTYEKTKKTAEENNRDTKTALNLAGSLLVELISSGVLRTTGHISLKSDLADETHPREFLAMILESIIRRSFNRFNVLYAQFEKEEGAAVH